MSSATISRDTPVDYDDAAHRYSFRDTRYTSATQMVELFHEQFDPIERSIAYAAKHGETPEYWREQWAAKNKKATDRGSAIHAEKENKVMVAGFDVHQSSKQRMDWIERFEPWASRPDGVYVENLMWHHGYHLAGKADKIFLLTDKITGIRYADIEDYKTNESLDKVSYQFKSGAFKMMLNPISHLMDCNLIHYTLQLSIYQFMMEYQGFRPGKRTIIHIPHPTAENPNPAEERIELPYLRKEVVLMSMFLQKSKRT